LAGAGREGLSLSRLVAGVLISNAPCFYTPSLIAHGGALIADLCRIRKEKKVFYLSIDLSSSLSGREQSHVAASLGFKSLWSIRYMASQIGALMLFSTVR
jgi:hypothetical protein